VTARIEQNPCQLCEGSLGRILADLGENAYGPRNRVSEPGWLRG